MSQGFSRNLKQVPCYIGLFAVSVILANAFALKSLPPKSGNTTTRTSAGRWQECKTGKEK